MPGLPEVLVYQEHPLAQDSENHVQEVCPPGTSTASELGDGCCTGEGSVSCDLHLARALGEVTPQPARETGEARGEEPGPRRPAWLWLCSEVRSEQGWHTPAHQVSGGLFLAEQGTYKTVSDRAQTLTAMRSKQLAQAS